MISAAIKKIFLNLLVLLWSLFVIKVGLSLFKYSNAQSKYQIDQQLVISAVIVGIFLSSWIFIGQKSKAIVTAVVLSAFFLSAILFAHSPLGILSTIFILVSAWSLGSFFLKDGSLAKSTTVGLAAFMAFMNYFSHTSLNLNFVYLILLAIPIVLRLRNWRWPKLKIDSPSFCFHLLLASLMVIVAPTLLNSLRPEIGFDAMSYQILAPYRLKQYGFFDFNPAVNSLAVMPQGVNWLYAIGLVLSGEIGMKILVVLLGILTACMCIEVGSDLKKSWQGIFAALGLITFPVFEMCSGYTFVENGILLFTVSSALFGILAAESKNKRYFIVALFLLFADLSTKQNSLIWTLIFGLGLLFFVYQQRKNQPQLWKSFLWTSFAGIICFVLPSYGYAYWRSGNPFFPFFNGLFKSPFYDPVSFNNTLFNHPYSWDLFYDMTKHSNKYLESDNGSAGVMLLLSFPLLFYWLYKNRCNWYGFCFGWAPWFYFFVTFHFQSYLRYLYPVIPLLFFGFAIAISEISNRLSKKIWTTAMITCCAIGFLLRGTTTFARDYELDKKWLWENREELINSFSDERNINQFLNAHYDNKCRMVHLNRPYNAFLNCDYYANTWHSWVFSSELAKATTAVQAYEVMKSFKISHVSLSQKAFPNPAWASDFIKDYLTAEHQTNDLILYKIKESSYE